MSNVRYQPLGPLLSGEGSRAFLGLQISAGAPPLPIALVWVPEDVAKDPDAAAKIARETNRAASLDHPNIIRVHGLASLDEGLARVVEFADGESLRTILNRCRKLAPPLAALVTADAAMGAHYAHVAGNDDGTPLIHGDIRPETLLVSFSGVCKVAGYGALGVAPREQGGKRVQGRRYHCAPEQVLGGRDANNRQTDVYLLGLVLYECLTGIVPFKDDPDFDLAVLNRPFPALLPEEVPPDLIAVMEKATAKRAAERYATTRALRDAIERAVGVLPAHEELATFLRKYYPEDAPARLARRREIESGIAELARREAERSRPSAPPAAPEAPPLAAPAAPEPRPNAVQVALSAPLDGRAEAPRELSSRLSPKQQRSIATYAVGALLVVGISAYWIYDRLSGSGSPAAGARSVSQAEAANAASAAPTTPERADVARPEAQPAAAAPAHDNSAPVQLAVAKPKETGSAPASAAVVSAGFAPTSLELTVEPVVDVSIDGRSVGRSPVKVPLSPGKHTVQLSDPSHGINATRAIKVGANGMTEQHVVLGKGVVEITAPDGAVISIDGKSVGTAPLKEIAVYEGKHRIQATFSGAKWQQAFTVAANEHMFFNIETTGER